MTSRLETLLGELQTALNAAMVAVYPGGITYVFARKGREQAGRPPRITWVPVDFDDSPVVGRVGGNPRSLASHDQGVDAVVWGATFEATEEIVFQLKRALINHVGASSVSLTLSGGTWAPDEWAQDGWAAVQRFSLRIPVLNTKPKTEVEGVEHTTGFAGSVADGCGNPGEDP